MGIRRIEAKMEMDAALNQKRVELLFSELEDILQNRTHLKDRLADFERRYDDIIKNLPDFKVKLENLKQASGLTASSPLRIANNQGIAADPDTICIPSHPSLFERITGRGQFYTKLALKVLSIINQQQHQTGGIIPLSDILLKINQQRKPGEEISLVNLERTLKRLQSNKLILGLKTLPSGLRMVECLPTEAIDDPNVILNIARNKGWTTLEEVMLETGWTPHRAQRIMKGLEESGSARHDKSYQHGQRWFFPGIVKAIEKDGSSPKDQV